MTRKIIISLFLLTILLFQSSPVLAEDLEGDDRKSQEYDELRYGLMTYADDSWWDVAGKTGTSVASSIKSFLWMTNLVIANIVLMIVYQLFSLDIIDMTKGAVQEITASTASSLIYNFGLFALAIASIGIIVRSYVQQNWAAFFKLLTLIMLSLTLLFSIQSKNFNYIDLADTVSTSLENTVMQANPSLTEDSSFQFVNFDENSAENISIAIENKVFDALIYKPYLLLQYGTTDQNAINAEASDRIDEYLEADPSEEDGIDKREEIAETEYKDYGNKSIFAGNAFKQAGYIMIMLLSTIVQAVVFFSIALVRILLQFAFIVMMLLAPIMLFLSIFPSFEALVGKYTKGTFILIVFKAITMFFVLVATSFITLGYDMTNASDDLYYRIFIQILFSVAVIFMYTKRQFVFNMLEGASPALQDFGAGEGVARNGLRKVRDVKNKQRQKKAYKNMSQGKQSTKKPNNNKSIKNRGVSAVKAGGANALGKTKNSARNAKNKVGETAQKTRDYIGQVQRGEIPNHENPYQTADHEVSAASERVTNSNGSSENLRNGNVAVLPSTKNNQNASARDPRNSNVHHLNNNSNNQGKQRDKKISTNASNPNNFKKQGRKPTKGNNNIQQSGSTNSPNQQSRVSNSSNQQVGSTNSSNQQSRGSSSSQYQGGSTNVPNRQTKNSKVNSNTQRTSVSNNNNSQPTNRNNTSKNNKSNGTSTRSTDQIRTGRNPRQYEQQPVNEENNRRETSVKKDRNERRIGGESGGMLNQTSRLNSNND